MLEIFLCCSPADREIAAGIAARLEHSAEATVAIDDSQVESVAAKWEGGLSSSAVLLLLSPESVPPHTSRMAWGPVLDHIAGNADPPVGSVLLRDCPYPHLLARKLFFRWESGAQDALRAIEEWAMRLHRLPQERSFVPAHLPWFEGRRDELDLLWQTLVDRTGTVILAGPAASGKTSLAQEFARQAGAHFRDVLWVACRDRSLAAIAADLAEQLGVECEGDAEGAYARLLELSGRHRVVLVLDDFQTVPATPEDPQGRASVLITTRSENARRTAAQVIRIVSAADAPLTLPDNPTDLRLWRAMAVCRPDGFPVELAAEIAGVEPGEARDACARLIHERLADPFDDAEGRLRLSAASVAAAGDSLPDERRRHAEAVHRTVSKWEKSPGDCKRCAAELMPALRWAAGSDWPLAAEIARRGFAFFRSVRRVAEGAELLVALRDAADSRGDWQVSDECSWELSWIRGVPYRGPDRARTEGDQLTFDFAS